MFTYGSRSDSLVVAGRAGGPSTCMYFVSDPLPGDIKQLRATIRCHNQGYCTNPADGLWTWWEVSVLRPWSERRQQDLGHLTTAVRQGIDSFGDDIQDSGWYLENLGNDNVPAVSRRILTVPLTLRSVSHQVHWAQGDHEEIALSGGDIHGILETIQEADRLVIWAMAQYHGWCNFLDGVQIELETVDPNSYPANKSDACEHSAVSSRRQAAGNTHSRVLEGSELLPESLCDEESHRSDIDEHTNSEPVADQAESAMLPMASGLSDQAEQLTMFGLLFARRYKRARQTIDLRLAIKTMEVAVQITPPTEYSHRVERLHLLGNYQLARYQHTEVMIDLHSVIEVTGDIVRVTPPEHPRYIYWLNDFVIMLLRRYECTEQIVDLETAIEAAEKAEKLESASHIAPADHASRAIWLNSFALSLQHRYMRTCQLADLDLAIDKARAAVREAKSTTPTGFSQRADWSINLANMLGNRYKHTGQKADLESAIKMSDEVIHSEDIEHPNRAKALQSLGNLLTERYSLTDQVADLDVGIKYAEDALIMPTNPFDQASRLNHFGVLLGYRYKRGAQEADLQYAIKVLEEAVEMTPMDYPRRGDWLNNLASMLLSRYERTDEMTDLDMAIKTAREAIRITPDSHVNRAARLNNLGSLLLSRHKRTGRTADLDSAIVMAKEAVSLTPTNDVSQMGRQMNYGIMLGHRYQYTGQIVDLDLAIDESEAVVLKTPADHPLRAGWLINLSNLLVHRYERIGQLANLELAIERTQDAISLTPIDHSQRAGWLNNLGTLIVRRYDRTGTLDDLNLAVEKAQEAVDITPPDHSERASWLNSLGSILLRRYEADKRTVDLDSAIDQAQEAERMTPIDHAKRAGYLNNLGSMLRNRYMLHHRLDDIELAIEKLEEAERLTPDGHPVRAVILHTLGMNQLASPDPAQKGKSLVSFVRSWHCNSGVPSQRLTSAVNAVKVLVELQSWDLAADLAVNAIGLIPIMNKRILSRDDQQQILSMYSGLAATACSLILQSGRPVEKSVEVLELGRGAIIGLLIDDRRDISDLRRLCPEEAGLYDRLRSEVQVGASNQKSNLTQEQQVKHSTKVVKELDECIARVRHVPGLERFQLGSSAQELQQQARAGPIIIVNATKIRSDAIIVESDRMRAISLPKFCNKQLRSWKEKDLTKYRNFQERKVKNPQYTAFLMWIWEYCVEVVFRSLDEDLSTSPIVRPNCRVWWVGVGDASGVPFHAAGDHSPGSKNNTFSRVVSSYTPTIKALEFAREKQMLEQASATAIDGTFRRKLCIATMPVTPKLSELAVTAEVDGIDGVAKSAFAITKLCGENSARVKEELQSCHIFHYAGHASVNPTDPSSSCLVLQKQDQHDSTLVQDRLSVKDISRMHLPHAYLAYLPACSTADIGAPLLADEVLHIVSGFQVAGFAHAIGSMWPSGNAICAKIAQAFYRILSQKQNDTNGDGVVAEALQSAVDEFRTSSDVQWALPLNWAQFVHFGA